MRRELSGLTLLLLLSTQLGSWSTAIADLPSVSATAADSDLERSDLNAEQQQRSLDSVCHELYLPGQVSIKPITGHPKYKKAIMNSKEQPVAYINQNAAASQFEVYDLQNKLVLTGREKISSSAGPIIELYNCNNAKIGVIKQDVEKSFLSADTSYSILDEKGNLLFQSEKTIEGSKTISVFDKNKLELASLTVARREKRFEASLKGQHTGDRALMLMATLKLYSDTK